MTFAIWQTRMNALVKNKKLIKEVNKFVNVNMLGTVEVMILSQQGNFSNRSCEGGNDE